jgi:hypothetical protein
MEKLKLSDPDIQRLKKTDIDFTFCDENYKPLLCIEFDGLQQGFNVGTSYYPKQGRDPWRKVIMGLKLKVAVGSMFPYFVFASRHFDNKTGAANLSIADGIIGAVMAERAYKEKIAQGFNPQEYGFSQDKFYALDNESQREYIEDWALGIQVQSDMENNPIVLECDKLSAEMGNPKYSLEFLLYPKISERVSSQEYRGLWDSAILHGSRCKVDSEIYGTAQEEVYLPNMWGVPGISLIAESLHPELAHLMALSKLKRQASK